MEAERLGEGMCQLHRKVTWILENQSYAKGEMTEQTSYKV